MSHSYRIQVPATSANLGVGFDRLGIALKFYNYFEASVADEMQVSVSKATCVDTQEMNLSPSHNLLAKAYLAYFKHFDLPVVNAHLVIEGHIPLSRGLGSSSSAIVGGVMLANLISGKQLEKEKLLPLVVELEGHPDNVTPALMGGLFDCQTNQIFEQLNWPSEWGLVFIVPPTPLSTQKARSVLPQEYSELDRKRAQHNIEDWKQAVANQSSEKLKSVLMNDVLHEPYRKNLITEYETVKQIISTYTDCLGLVISGAGSTLLTITPTQNAAKRLKDHLKAKTELEHCKIMHIQVDTEGAKLQAV